jgi:transposase
VIFKAIAHRISHALIESVNAKFGLITRIASGFKNVDALTALAMLSLGGHRPAPPAETNPRMRQEIPLLVRFHGE